MSIICTLLSIIPFLSLQQDHEWSDGPFPSYYVGHVTSLTSYYKIEIHMKLKKCHIDSYGRSAKLFSE